ncbi:MAG: dephospho-CoA kinase [Kineosporiaceae bacterium]
MLRVGVTGGIAAGKSSAVAVLGALGAVVVDADAIARQVLAPGRPAAAEVVAEFGDTVRAPEGGVDRPALARLVFADPASRARLEAITHPRIQAEAARRFAAAPPDAVVVHDIPLLVELDLADRYHLVVVVGAPAEERVTRLVSERGMAEPDARARVAAQADDDRRRAAADVWLDNTGAPDALREAVRRLWHDRLVPYEGNLRERRRAERPDRPVLVAADPGWPAAGERLVARVRRAAGDRALDVAHVGSTAVPGLPAKDVIDLQVVVADLVTAHELAADLAGAGLVPVPDRWDEPVTGTGRVAKAFAANADPGRAVNCHVRPADSPVVAEVLAFRDRLRAEPALRDDYARLKRELGSRPWQSIDDYARAKTDFVAAVVRGAARP